MVALQGSGYFRLFGRPRVGMCPTESLRITHAKLEHQVQPAVGTECVFHAGDPSTLTTEKPIVFVTISINASSPRRVGP